VTLDLPDGIDRLRTNEMALFRILQESLTNGPPTFRELALKSV